MYVTYQKKIYISQMNVLTLNLDGKCCESILELASFSNPLPYISNPLKY